MTVGNDKEYGFDQALNDFFLLHVVEQGGEIRLPRSAFLEERNGMYGLSIRTDGDEVVLQAKQVASSSLMAKEAEA